VSFHRILGLAALLGLTVAACSQAATFPEDAITIRANNDIGVGAGRLLVGVSLFDGTRVGSPDDPVILEVAAMDEPSRTQQAAGTFTWMVPDVFGLYRADFDFDRPGVWQVTVIPETGDPLEPAAFVVLEETEAPNIGDRAPIVDTPTLGEFPIGELTTDPEPDPRFYQQSLDEALTNGRQTVVVFSTPAYCVTAACGPLLDVVKDAAPAYPNVDFVHVEVYTGFREPGFAVDAAHLSPAVTQEYWNLPSEPWVFVVDESGVIEARFEGVMDIAELEQYLTS
jgi:hypothetical protein